MGFLLGLLALVTVSQVSAEYIWTGTEWKWQDPDSSDSVALDTIDTPDDTETDILDTDSEGSGNVDTWDDGEDYDDDYDYDLDYRNTKQNNKKEKKEEKKKDKKDRQKNRDFYPSNSNSAILPASDDEDFFDGSGDTDGFVSPQNNFNFNNNNNNNYQYNTESPISSSNNNNNQNEYREEDEEYDYDEDYEYDNYDPIQNNVNSVDPTNGFQDNYNPNPTPSTTVRSFTTKRTTITTTTKRPNAGSEHDENNRIRVNRPASFFAQPGILAAVIGGAVVGLLCAILLVMFIVYRMRKKDEGSYALDEPKRSHNVNSYSKPPNREFYA